MTGNVNTSVIELVPANGYVHKLNHIDLMHKFTMHNISKSIICTLKRVDAKAVKSLPPTSNKVQETNSFDDGH